MDSCISVGPASVTSWTSEDFREIPRLCTMPGRDQRHGRQGAEHLLMSFKKPGEQYVVGDWVRDAIREVSLCRGMSV
ncbi:hypothetical protein OE88DRAFT_1650306 [Heliocybe sulcata]|uniref:Uncharacterized protein n=1 Tax=Heliocybe sulcata TaxID=5364 RepID=A0A5C3NL06_9AGAM|nr:hypothetical protein OE88DRAFT_1650306 [Heliocybe sulcata]